MAKPRKPMRVSATAMITASAPFHQQLNPVRELRVPELPASVWGRKRSMAMDDSGWGGFSGNYLNTGLAPFGLFFPGYPYLAELSQLAEYRAPTEAIARLMTRRWIEFGTKGTGDKKDKIKQIQDEFDRFGIQDICRIALEKDGYFGRAQIAVNIKRQDRFRDKPLMVEPGAFDKGDLIGFKVIEPMWTTPIVWNSIDPFSFDFYRPDRWMVLGKETHASRLMTLISREVPDLIKPAYNFSGLSLSQLIQPYVNRWLRAAEAVNRLITNFSIVTLKTELGDMLAGGDGSSQMNRARLFTQQRDNQGLFLTDKEREDLDILSVTLAGLSELQAQSQEHMAAPVKLPLVYLTGITPAGLGASSEGEIEVCHEWIHGGQEAILNPHVRKMLNLVQLNRWGSIDPDITYVWRSLNEVTGEAAARMRKDAADAGNAYIQAGVIVAQEERERIANDPTSGYNNLDTNKEIVPPLEEGEESQDNDDDAEAA